MKNLPNVRQRSVVPLLLIMQGIPIVALFSLNTSLMTKHFLVMEMTNLMETRRNFMEMPIPKIPIMETITKLTKMKIVPVLMPVPIAFGSWFEERKN